MAIEQVKQNTQATMLSMFLCTFLFLY